MHYYQFNIADYRKDTMHLTPIEHYIYRALLDTYYLSEKPLTLDHNELMRTHCLRSADDMQALCVVLKDFFVADETGYSHKRCDIEIEEFHSKSKSASESAKARWERVRCERIANAMQTQSEGNANHKPITINHKPETTNQESKSKTESKPIARAKPAPDENLKLACQETWARYSQAYFDRYGTDPVRNVKINSCVKQFVQRIGLIESPLVASYYLSHNESYYVRKMHSFTLLLSDAEKLRTEWVTGRMMTQTRAQQSDKSSSMLDIVREIQQERGEL